MECAKENNKDKVLMIGDSYSADIAGAVNFGIDAVWYNPLKTTVKEANATFTASTYDEILNFLKKAE